MGIARYLRHAAPILAVTGCNADTVDSTADLQRRAQYEQKVDRLEDKVSQLQLESTHHDKMIDALSNDVGTVNNAINNNAKIANRNAARDMTRRGACGIDYIRLEDGSYRQINKTCTEKDLTAG